MSDGPEAGVRSLLLLPALAVAILMAIVSGMGLFTDGIYRDNALVVASWRGNDLVTLILAVPLLAGSIARMRRGSTRARLVCLGLLAYAAYNYAFYVFGAAFNSLFLLYVGLLTFSTLGLIGGLASPEIRPASGHIRTRPRDRLVGWLILLVSLILGIFWIATSVSFLFTGVVPAMVTATGHPTNVTAALDLWLVVAFGVLGGIWLIRSRAWGFIICAVWAVKGAVYMTALSAASVSTFVADATDSLAQLGLWIPIGIVCVLGVAVLMRADGPAGELGRLGGSFKRAGREVT